MQQEPDMPREDAYLAERQRFWAWVASRCPGVNPRGDFIRDTRDILNSIYPDMRNPDNAIMKACAGADAEYRMLQREWKRSENKKNKPHTDYTWPGRIIVPCPPLWPTPNEMARLCHTAIGALIEGTTSDDTQSEWWAGDKRGEGIPGMFRQVAAQVGHVLLWLNSDQRHHLSDLRDTSEEGVAHGPKGDAEEFPAEGSCWDPERGHRQPGSTNSWVARAAYETAVRWWLEALDQRTNAELCAQ